MFWNFMGKRLETKSAICDHFQGTHFFQVPWFIVLLQSVIAVAASSNSFAGLIFTLSISLLLPVLLLATTMVGLIRILNEVGKNYLTREI